jgi:hypothetical protein
MKNTLKTYTVRTVYSFTLDQEVQANNENEAEDIALNLNKEVDGNGLLNALSNGWNLEASYIEEVTD